MKLSLAMMISILLAGGCGRDLVAEELKLKRIELKVPFKGHVLADTPTGLTFLSEEVLICQYISEKVEEGSAIYFVDTGTGTYRVLEFPYVVSMARISAEEIATKRISGVRLNVAKPGESTVSFIDTRSLRERVGPQVPQGPYYHMGGVDLVLMSPKEEDLWIYDRATGRQYMFPASRHGLAKIYATMAPGRLLISGREAPGSEDFWRLRTQLWSFPQFERIAEYQSTGPWPGEHDAPQIFGELFAYPLDAAKWQVAGLRDGKARFIVGHEFSGNNPLDDGPKTMLFGGEYTEKTGVILTAEDVPGHPVTLNAYDVSNGQRLRTVELQSPAPVWDITLHVTKVSGQWMLFEELGDPRGKPNRCTKQFVAYRIADFGKMKGPISVKWNGYVEPIIDKGQLVIPWKDHLLLGSLASIVTFDKDDGAGN